MMTAIKALKKTEETLNRMVNVDVTGQAHGFALSNHVHYLHKVRSES